MVEPAAPAPGKANELQTRIIVGALLIVAAVLAEYFGGIFLWLLVVLMALGIMSEWARLTGRQESRMLAMYALSVPLAIMSPWAAGPSFLVLGLIIGAAMFSYVLHLYWGLPFYLVLLSIPLAVLAQMGDLFESWLKRKAGAKDSGTIFPGHGGVMDRLDGLIPVAPVVALIMLAENLSALS